MKIQYDAFITLKSEERGTIDFSINYFMLNLFIGVLMPKK